MDTQIIDLPKIEDPRGNLTFIESESHIPFEIQRVYWIYDVPGGQIRGDMPSRNNKNLSAKFKRRKFILSRKFDKNILARFENNQISF